MTESSRWWGDGWGKLGIGLLALGTCVRINNALQYRIELGFDAHANWLYISQLMDSWALPAPDSGWSTAHPPFFYYVSAALARTLEASGPRAVQIAVPLASALTGLSMVACAVCLARRVAPDDSRRAVISGALILFLPAHIYMSAMLSEEILAASLISLAISATALQLTRDRGWDGVSRASQIGVAAGLALLTKLSGVLVIGASTLSYAFVGARRGSLRRGLICALALGTIASGIGSWYYVRNLATYGYLYPQDLAVHGLILRMPPGERELSDYLRVPIATWTDPQLLNPDLLRSVWGGTYATLWFDGHRHFLPRSNSLVRTTGTAILLLALLPTLAFVNGLLRAVRRVARGEGDSDVPLLLLGAVTLAGYVYFTWNNPYYACVKGSYLLGMSVPFAHYASESLSRWMARPGARRALVCAILGCLIVAVVGTFSFGVVFEKQEGAGLLWQQLHPG